MSELEISLNGDHFVDSELSMGRQETSMPQASCERGVMFHGGGLQQDPPTGRIIDDVCNMRINCQPAGRMVWNSTSNDSRWGDGT